jgi:hypothetical protein
MALIEKKIPDWNTVRDIIDNVDDIESRNTLRVSYIFGSSIQELIRGRTRKVTIRGNDFFTDSIEGEEALILKIPTARRGYKPRNVAVPLNPKCEPWSEKILSYSEEKANDYFYRRVNREIQYDIQRKYFADYEWPPTWYEGKANMHIDRIPFRHKHLSEIREWELGLCHNFTEFDYKHFFGKYYDSDYKVYFRKLLNKPDYFETEDIINSIMLKNRVFSRERNRYDYKVFMKIQKMIKRNYIEQLPPKKMYIDSTIDVTPIPKLSGRHHRILQANIKKCLERDSDQVVCEESNIDVVDLINGKVVECGHTEASKLLDSFNGVFSGIGDVTEFSILTFYDQSDNISVCNSFLKTGTYQ